MAKEIRVPALGESVTEATIAKWFKNVGDAVKADEPMVELETDKVTVEVPAPASGKLTSISAAAGTTVNVGALLGAIEEGAAGAATKPAAAAPAAAPAALKIAEPTKVEMPLSPAVRKIVTENKLDPATIPATGKDGRLTKGDVIEQLAKPVATPVSMLAAAPAPSGGEERVKMSRLRLTIARRLKEAQNTAAMLTTFNEVDMSAVMNLRNSFKDVFEKKHGVKLGFMSFFAKAVIQALKD
ncbi:MAG: biotin/lipoyl-containing protein, partial [Aestuariivirga sp.]|nr:biotin/lipoyl-containing protein [Aestuariivirga sp.]